MDPKEWAEGSLCLDGHLVVQKWPMANRRLRGRVSSGQRINALSNYVFEQTVTQQRVAPRARKKFSPASHGKRPRAAAQRER